MRGGASQTAWWILVAVIEHVRQWTSESWVFSGTSLSLSLSGTSYSLWEKQRAEVGAEATLWQCLTWRRGIVWLWTAATRRRSSDGWRSDGRSKVLQWTATPHIQVRWYLSFKSNALVHIVYHTCSAFLTNDMNWKRETAFYRHLCDTELNFAFTVHTEHLCS